MKKFYIETFGCQMNEYDSEKIHGILNSVGYSLTSIPENADLIILNTCLIRENAEHKLFGRLGSFKNMVKDSPDKILSICGCIPQKDEIRNTILEKYSYVDLIFGTNTFNELPELLLKVKKSKEKIISIKKNRTEVIEDTPMVRKFNHKGFVNITYGCDNFCSYCIVPYTRGKEVSRSENDIINEISSLSKYNYKEVTLLGQNVNSYISPNNSEYNFQNLLSDICENTNISRVRFMSSHPKDVSDVFIETMALHDKICNYIHLPVQSGSNKVLKEMNRKYTREKYMNIVNKLRTAIPEITVSTDIIVGFPGETEADFQDTLDLVKNAKFDGAFTYIYSPRHGTSAAARPDQIDEKIIHERFERLLDTLHPIINESNREYLNKTVSVLVDEKSKNNNSYLTGRTETNKLVHFKGTADLIGKIVDVYITLVKTWHLEGLLVEDE